MYGNACERAYAHYSAQALPRLLRGLLHSLHCGEHTAHRAYNVLPFRRKLHAAAAALHQPQPQFRLQRAYAVAHGAGRAAKLLRGKGKAFLINRFYKHGVFSVAHIVLLIKMNKFHLILFCYMIRHFSSFGKPSGSFFT